ncbi:FAD-dependent oxidoreductase [Sinorhizobium mexicanum]|uniref:FAD-dependent oxidoreductase n=1 Tax=Sinorhizobium mexicanum TaxID=375549 RepID=A0A859QHQ0_9HYPH|nr:FAD-dependent oxidoreductase [Sinorhizobium mexicanum]MBP1887976.1 2,4-dienoyl-CoA reductase-like NADH-dependent reductase (Old Yellow Enzyme family)/thioredoxin reductase [Sinorhizobium mexicanum]QLL60037.1 FAD-dependent oxidoreductase [Sinorhizobium mexicanum]
MPKLFPHLFSPIELGGRTLRNRIVFGAHTANMAEGGLPTERHAAYYAERAIGGAAMIVVEPMPVHPAAVLTRGNFRPSDDSVIPHFRKVAAAIKDNGAVAIQQLYHIGAHGDSDNSYHPHWSPSGLPSYHDSDGSHPMSEAEIWETIDGFVQAARRCQEAGFDGVEVWAAYLGLVDQFWTPWSNRRDDDWGGSLENRTRMSREILTRIRAICGSDFIVGLAVSDEPDYSVALSREALAEIVGMHDELGLIDYVTCGSGGYLDFHKLMPTFLYPEKLGADLAATLKRTVKKALVIAESHIRTPENAETVLGEGAADLVSIVRGQIADPHLARKASDDRPDDIRGCISCNQMCWGRRSRDYWISCLINPSAGREFEWGGDRFTRTAEPKKVLVVGGGPAGLEAARVAAERGHKVTLVEASSRLGGSFLLAGMQPRRGQILDLIQWYERQLAKLQVDVRLNCYLEASEISDYGADSIVLATGSLSPETGFQKALPAVETLPGMEKGNVFAVEAIMARQARPGKRVLLLDEGGGWRGCGTAWKLAEDGHEVTILSPDPFIGKELQRTTADVPLRRILSRLNVNSLVEVSVVEWHGNGATIVDHNTGQQSFVEGDCLVLATTNMSANWLAHDLQGQDLAFHQIGDCAAPRQAPFAFYEGRKVALEL